MYLILLIIIPKKLVKLVSCNENCVCFIKIFEKTKIELDIKLLYKITYTKTGKTKNM